MTDQQELIDRITEQEKALAVLRAENERLEEDNTGLREAYRLAADELGRLDKWLREHFPKQERGGVGTVDAAIQILTLCHTYVPELMRIVWNQLIRPSVHFFQRYGVGIEQSLADAVKKSEQD